MGIFSGPYLFMKHEACCRGLRSTPLDEATGGAFQSLQSGGFNAAAHTGSSFPAWTTHQELKVDVRSAASGSAALDPAVPSTAPPGPADPGPTVPCPAALGHAASGNITSGPTFLQIALASMTSPPALWVPHIVLLTLPWCPAAGSVTQHNMCKESDPLLYRELTRAARRGAAILKQRCMTKAWAGRQRQELNRQRGLMNLQMISTGVWTEALSE
ncbi:uncharacterized protein LOC115367300 [Myripristis murdjan]|uniref:uncharacterized protein LOC115367300 n=1 Tax=Myripristis murdjan TaxID=586833 RepID=UPI0011763975|nr:uncharacterized protein LOC115367300 [Myripristis murdjan]